MVRRNMYGSEEKLQSFLSKHENSTIEGISKEISDLIIQFVKDFRIGINISPQSKKGPRDAHSLNNKRQKLIFVFRKLNERGIDSISKLKEEDLHRLFAEMRTGVLPTKKGLPFKSAGDYVVTFKTFWHWYQRVMKKNKKEIIEDITVELDRRGEKPKFVYFTEQDFEKLVEKASYDMKPILALAFDTGSRPTELMNIKVSDFSKDFKEVVIREETSKTFGRKIKLMLCSEQIKKYIELLGLKQDDYVIQKSQNMINKELRALGKKVLTAEQIKFKSLAMYSFRHSSACYWVVRYKSEAGLKYRFGWKKTDMIHYYTEYLGMKDTITEDDMYVDITKVELEKEVEKLKEQTKSMEEMKSFYEHYKKLFRRMQQNPDKHFIASDGDICHAELTADGKWID